MTQNMHFHTDTPAETSSMSLSTSTDLTTQRYSSMPSGLMTPTSIGPATMIDVAAKAGVSRATVSRVFTAPDSVAAPTRERVLKAVSRLGYIPNGAARSLRSGRSNTIALLVGGISQPFHGQLAKAVANTAEEHGYSVLEEKRWIPA